MIPTLGMLMSLRNRGGKEDDKYALAAENGPLQANQGPPDLEEVWRDFNRRLASILGQNKGGGEQHPPPGGGFNPRFLGGGLSLIAGLLVLVWLASGFYIVDASERGIVLQFGSYKETTEPGLRWRLPYPFQSHELVNLSGVRTIEIGYRGSEKTKVLKEALMLTDDENIVNIQFAVQYLLKDPKEYLFNNRGLSDDRGGDGRSVGDSIIMGVAETAIREVVGKSKMDYVLYEGRDQIAVQATKLMQEILDRYKSGVYISKVTMQNAQPPEQVQAAFDDAVKAGQDRERQKNEGQAYANDVVPKAEGTASRLLQEAEGHKQRVIASAEGDAARFSAVVSEYAKAPQVTRQRMYLDTMQQIFANNAKVLVDAKGQGNLLYLPLDKLMQAGATMAQVADGHGGGRKPAPAAAAEVSSQNDKDALFDARNRAARLSREREGR